MAIDPTYVTRLVPTQDDIQDQMFHFRYNCANDMYERLSSASTRRNSGWQNLTYGDARMKRHEDRDAMCSFLGRHSDQESASIAWKIDMQGTGVHGKQLELQASSQVTGEASLTWKIVCDDKSHVFSGQDLHTPQKVDVQGYNSVTIIAEMQGGQWHDAQLFRQHIAETNTYPFEVKLQMASAYTMLYRLTNLEKRQRLFQLRYCSANDTYHRKSSGTYMEGLQSGMYQCEGGLQEEEEGKVYWARKQGTDQAVYRWMIDTSDSGLSVQKMSLMAKCKTYDTGNVTWKISADDKAITHAGEHLYTARHINMKRSKVITLEATVSGGSGATPWKQAQLFRQAVGAKEHVFDCKLFLVQDATEE